MRDGFEYNAARPIHCRGRRAVRRWQKTVGSGMLWGALIDRIHKMRQDGDGNALGVDAQDEGLAE